MCLPHRVPLCSGSSITEIINPNYMGVGAFGHMKQALSPEQQPTAWSYDQPLKDSSLGPGRGESPSTPPSQPPLSPKRFPSSTASRGPCPRTQESRPGDVGKNVVEPLPPEDPKLTKPEMFENPLYGSVSSFPKLVPRKEQESPKMLKKELPPCPDPGTLASSVLVPKAQEAEGCKGTGKPGPAPAPAPAPFLSPTPRLRSFTCSSPAEGRPAAPGDKGQGKPKAPASTQAPVPAKRPVKPSRSELSQQAPPTPAQRPPLPLKSPAVLHLQHSKGRDYRENTELPHHGKHRPAPEDPPLSRAAMQVRRGTGVTRGLVHVTPPHPGGVCM